MAARRLADKRLRVTIVEADLVGRECSDYACMPSKALLRPAHALSEARRVPGAAEPVTASLDVAAVLSRRDMIVGHRRCSVVDALQRTRSRIGPRCDALERLTFAKPLDPGTARPPRRHNCLRVLWAARLVEDRTARLLEPGCSVRGHAVRNSADR